MDTAAKTSSPVRTSRGSIVFAFAGSGVAWLLHLLLAYLAAEFGCVAGLGRVHLAGINAVSWIIIGATLLTAAIAAAAIFLSRRIMRRGTPDEAALARIALAQGGLFLFIILMESIPVLYYLGEC